jgi:hypothetical protein
MPKKLLPWIAVLAIVGAAAGWLEILHSDPHEAGIAWMKTSPAVAEGVGTIGDIKPDIGKYRVGSSGALSQAHFAVFVSGSRKTERVELVVQKSDAKNWRVVDATIEGRHVEIEPP